MVIIGWDYHPSVQQIAFVDSETGECKEQRLNHSDGEAERVYRELKGRGSSVRVGIEATGHSRWFERLLAELNYELWIGDPLQIKAMRVRKQKTDRQDAQLLLKLLLEERFPRVCVLRHAQSECVCEHWRNHIETLFATLPLRYSRAKPSRNVPLKAHTEDHRPRQSFPSAPKPIQIP